MATFPTSQSGLQYALGEALGDFCFIVGWLAIGVIQNASNPQRRIINNILDFSTIAAGKLSLFEKIDFALNTTRLASLNPIAAGKALNVESASSPGPEAFRTKKTSTEATCCNLKVLLVDDNALNLRLGQTLLKRFGCEVITAGDGEEAIQRLRSNRYDLALIDCQMPVMDGYATSRKVRELEAMHATTTLSSDRPLYLSALTADTSEDDRQSCLTAGMDDYIPKPMQISDLSRVLKEAQKRQKTP